MTYEITITELDIETVELLPDRAALCCVPCWPCMPHCGCGFGGVYASNSATAINFGCGGSATAVALQSINVR